MIKAKSTSLLNPYYKLDNSSYQNPYSKFVSPSLYQAIKIQTNSPKESIPIDDLQPINTPKSPPKINDGSPSISSQSVLNNHDSNTIQTEASIKYSVPSSLTHCLVKNILTDSIINIDKTYKQLILPAKPATHRAFQIDTTDLKPLIQFCHDHNKSTFLGLKALKDSYPDSSILCIDDVLIINKLIQNQLGCTTLNPKNPKQLKLDLAISMIPKETTIILLDVDFDFSPNMKINPDEIGSIIKQKEMIDYNGLDIAKKVKELKEFEHIKFFLISAASSLNELKERILNKYIDGYVFCDKNIKACKSYVKDLIPNVKTDVDSTHTISDQRDTYEETDTSSTIPSTTTTPIQVIKKESNNEINSNEVLESISNCMATKITRIPTRPENPKGSNTVFPGRYIHNRQ